MSLTLNGFAYVLETLAVPVAASAALDTAASLIEKQAKDEIGEYQRADMGAYAPWAELADSTKADRLHQGFSENEPLLRTGELRDSISRETHGLESVVGSTSDVMVYQELGTRTIPPRSVLGLAATRKEREVIKLIGAAVVSELIGGRTRRLDGAVPLLPAGVASGE